VGQALPFDALLPRASIGVSSRVECLYICLRELPSNWNDLNRAELLLIVRATGKGALKIARLLQAKR
jgi:hypothetical protein